MICMRMHPHEDVAGEARGWREKMVGFWMEGVCLDGSLSRISRDRESAPCYCGRKKRRII